MAPVQAIRDVAAAGAQGISDPAYAAWVRVGPANLGRLEAAVRAGDADAAFAALRDSQDGLSLLTQGYAGCPGWSGPRPQSDDDFSRSPPGFWQSRVRDSPADPP